MSLARCERIKNVQQNTKMAAAVEGIPPGGPTLLFLSDLLSGEAGCEPGALVLASRLLGGLSLASRRVEESEVRSLLGLVELPEERDEGNFLRVF